MKRLCICIAALMLLCGCGKNAEAPAEQVQQNQNQATAPLERPVYVTPDFENTEIDSVKDLKCSVRYSTGDKLVFEADNAKQLYKLFTEIEKTELKEVTTKEADYIALLFEGSNAGTDIEKGFIVYNNDEMEETINPYVTSMYAYSVADGTYQAVLDKVSELG